MWACPLNLPKSGADVGLGVYGGFRRNVLVPFLEYFENQPCRWLSRWYQRCEREREKKICSRLGFLLEGHPREC